MKGQRDPGLKALAEVALLFAPALPAYLWLWPVVSGTPWLLPTQVLVYLYFLAGSLWIGLRRWSLGELGLNQRGLWLSLICGGNIIVGFLLGRLALGLAINYQPKPAGEIVGWVVFYVLMVGLTEELLFRGLIYKALETWRGTGWAIFGSGLAFGLYHFGSQGLLGGWGTFVIGLIFAMIRWRAGGITGLIFIHGLYDILATFLWPTLTAADIKIRLANPTAALLAEIFIWGTIIYLWRMKIRRDA